jgi:hypothetical protein
MHPGQLDAIGRVDRRIRLGAAGGRGGQPRSGRRVQRPAVPESRLAPTNSAIIAGISTASVL